MTHGSQDPEASLGCDHFSDMNDLDSFGLIDPVLYVPQLGLVCLEVLNNFSTRGPVKNTFALSPTHYGARAGTCCRPAGMPQF